MSSVPAIISELIRAANEIERVSRAEKCVLLERAAFTFAEMREKMAALGVTPDWTPGMAAYRWRVMSLQIDDRTDAEVAAALLDAARLLRTAHVALDAKFEVTVEHAEPEERA